ncbi:CpaD family pilus assembly protein [Sphingomonas immobilis]|nr:CpaD family pilus assembly protein [Sphingomonas sp. CA1-15]
MILVALATPALMLGACTGGTQNRGLESVHQPVVSRTDFVFDVNASRNGLAPGEAQRLSGWLASLKLGYGDQVAIDDPNAYGPGARDVVAAQVARYGLLLSEDAPVSGAPVAPGTVRIVISRMKASVPGCPDYSRATQPEFESNTSSNHGCAINSNLAAMVASPADLVRGQTGNGVTDAAAASKAIDAFRKQTPTGAGGLKSEGTK